MTAVDGSVARLRIDGLAAEVGGRLHCSVPVGETVLIALRPEKVQLGAPGAGAVDGRLQSRVFQGSSWLFSIQTELGFGPGGVTWVVNAYVLAFAGLLLLSGRAADLFGRRRVFVVGGSLFTLGSLRDMLQQTGYEVLEVQGIPAPFPKALGMGRCSLALVRLNGALLRLHKALFAYQFFLRIRPLPTVSHLLARATRYPAQRQLPPRELLLRQGLHQARQRLQPQLLRLPLRPSFPRHSPKAAPR